MPPTGEFHTPTHTHREGRGRTEPVCGEFKVDLSQKFVAEETAPSEDRAANAPQACFQSPPG